MKVLTVILLLVPLTLQLCFPDEDLKECYNRTTSTTERVVDVVDVETTETIEVRSLITGRYCFSTQGYSGRCQYSSDCKGRSYSYSRTCGWKHVCCKGSLKNISQRDLSTNVEL